MKTFPIALLLTLASPALADPAPTPITLKRAAELARATPAIAKAEGAAKAAQLRLTRSQARLKRYTDLLAAHAIDEESYRGVKRDTDIAAADVDKANASLAHARTNKERLQAENTCETGDCAPLVKAWNTLLSEDAELARVAVAKQDAWIAYDQYERAAHAALARDDALDWELVTEDDLELQARQAERDALETSYEQLQTAGIQSLLARGML